MNLGRWKEFVSLVETVTDECVLWPHHLTHDGYGRIYHEGRHRYVNVLACTWAHGPNPGGMEAAHSCAVRNCINPRHLSWKTHQENMVDMVVDGHGCVAKTHCPKGHPYDEENTRHWRGTRICRTCQGWKGASR